MCAPLTVTLEKRIKGVELNVKMHQHAQEIKQKVKSEL